MKRRQKWQTIAFILIGLLVAEPVKADFWGGDLPLLIQIVTNTAQQLVQLGRILGTGADTLKVIEDINRGVREAMLIIRTQNTTLSSGVFSQLQNLDQVMGTVEQLYGRVPNTPEAPLQRTTDQSAAEGIEMHNEVFKYAKDIDIEGEKIKDYAKDVNPLGAQRLTAESMGVLIHVMNQLLRTNAAILKIQSQQLAMGNRRQKLESEQFKMQYEGLARGFSELRPDYSLPSMSGY